MLINSHGKLKSFQSSRTVTQYRKNGVDNNNINLKLPTTNNSQITKRENQKAKKKIKLLFYQHDEHRHTHAKRRGHSTSFIRPRQMGRPLYARTRALPS